MNRLLLALVLSLGAASAATAQTTAQPIPLTQNWTNTGLITADNNWSGVTGIIGYRGDDLTTATGTDPQTILADGATTPVSVLANQTNPNTLGTGAVAEFDGIANPVVALQGSATADAPHLVFRVNATGFQTITVAYNVRDIDGSTDNSAQAVALQYRVGATGAYTNIPTGFVADATTGPSLATLVTAVNVALPAAANNQADVYIRVITTNAGGTDEWVGIDDISVTGTPTTAGETASVTFNPTAATVAEGGTATATIVLAIANDSGTAGLNTAVSGTVVVPAANSGDVSFTGTFSFAAGSANGATTTISITATDDTAFEATEAVPFTFSTVTGGTGAGTFTLTITDNDPAPNLFINEIDSDTPGTDTAEFVELYAAPAPFASPTAVPLDGYVLVFFNGANNQSYLAVDLDGQSTAATGIFVLCDQAANVANCTLDLAGTAASGFIQNGEDAVALYLGNASDFLNGTAPTTTGLLDAVVYGTDDPLASGLLTGLGQAVQFEENYNVTDTESLSRTNFPFFTTIVSELYYGQTPTPGVLNGSSVEVDATDEVANLAGWRLLGLPLLTDPLSGPFDVADLAPINLVQGIPAGTTNPAQYPQAPGANLLTAYSGSGTSAGFTRPSSTDTTLPPGSGFFWYFYDQNIIPAPNGPFGPGTSQSYELTNPAFSLSLTGYPVDNGFNGLNGPPSTTVNVSPDGLYMAANPFAYPFRLSGVTVTGATASTNFSVFDPATGSYTTLTQNDVVSPWQGVFAQATAPAGATITVATDADAVVPTSDVTLVGRPADAEARLNLRLDGALASGATVADYASGVRFLDDATTGWDRHDGTKLSPPQAEQALVAFVGELDGEAVRQAVQSLPLGMEDAVTTPVVFRASEAGTFALSWNAAGLPDGWLAELRDVTTGAVVDLRSTESYSFTSDAAEWAERFTLVLAPRGAVATEGTPAVLSLGLPYPNPATSQASLSLRVDAAQHVTATVVDALGRTVATVFDAPLAAGAEQMLTVPTGALAPGVYVVRVQGESFAQSRRLVVAR